jgi:hypothetical protein
MTKWSEYTMRGQAYRRGLYIKIPPGENMKREIEKRGKCKRKSKKGERKRENGK